MTHKQRGILAIAVILALTAVSAALITPYALAANVQVMIKPGPLAADYIQTPALAPVDMAGFDQVTTGTLGLMEIRDARGTGLGWNLVLEAAGFISQTDPGHTISAAGFNVMAAPPVNRLAGNALPQSFSGPLTPALTLLSAAPNTGMGRFQTEPLVSLAIPADTFAGTYDSTLTLTLTTGP